MWSAEPSLQSHACHVRVACVPWSLLSEFDSLQANSVPFIGSVRLSWPFLLTWSMWNGKTYLKNRTAVAAFSRKAKRRTKRATRGIKGKVSCLTLFTSNYWLIITERVLTVFLAFKCLAMTAINNWLCDCLVCCLIITYFDYRINTSVARFRIQPLFTPLPKVIIPSS